MLLTLKEKPPMKIPFSFLKICLLIVWQMQLIALFAQKPNLRFEKVEFPDGPVLANITCIYEDSRGFLWFGGFSGLFMYDGHKLTPFLNNSKDSLSLSDNKVRRIMEDKKGNFWVGTQNGLNYFDLKKHTFKRYNVKEKHGLGVESINEIKIDKGQNVWVGTNRGVYLFDSIHQKFNRYSYLKSDSAAIFRISFSNTGIYINTIAPMGKSNLYYKDFKSDTATSIAFPNPNPFEVFAEEGKLWIAIDSRLYYINTLTNSTLATEYPINNDSRIYIFLKKIKDDMWFFGEKGLEYLNIKTAKIERYSYNPIFPQGYPENNFTNAFISSSNILWTQTINGDLYTADFSKIRFQSVPYNIMNKIKGAGELSEIYEYSPNNLLVRQKEGTGILNILTGKITPFPYKPDYNLKGWEGGIICFFEEKDDKLWIGTGGGLFLFDKKTNRFINLENEIKDFSMFKTILPRAIHRDKQGNLWITTWSEGTFKVDFEKKTIKQYLKRGTPSNGRSIMETKDGQIWIGTRGGIGKYIANADTFKVYKQVLNNPESMSENTGFAMYEDEQKNIWVGTYGGGLNKLDIKTEKFKHYTTDDGLIDNNVVSIVPDKKGNFWLGTFSGISVFNPSTESFQNFNKKSGLSNVGYSSFFYGKGRYSDRLFYGGDTDIDFFYPDSISPSTIDPNIHLTDFKLFNKTVLTKGGNQNTKTFFLDEDIAFIKQITLKYEQNVVGFDFVALDYSSPKTVKYAYKLEGFDTAWQYIGNQRSATFTNLNPGDYTFKVKATNGDGIWGTKMATLKLTILAPWWQTWWFRSLVFFTISGLAYVFYRYRFNQIKEKEALKSALNQRIAEVEMEALRSQMSPHFIFNCLSAITRFILNHENDAATLYLTKFSRLVRLVLNHSQKETIPLSKELDAIQLYLDMEELRFHEQFTYTINVDKSLETDKISVPPMLIQPYLENAVWHGLLPKKTADNRLEMDIKKEGNSLMITIEDNGIGREKAADLKSKTALSDDHKSFGMKLTAERFDIINKMNLESASVKIIDLKNEIGEGIGTRVVLTLPIL
jgi:ligand-binding sensor domain-containing protein